MDITIFKPCGINENAFENLKEVTIKGIEFNSEGKTDIKSNVYYSGNPGRVFFFGLGINI